VLGFIGHDALDLFPDVVLRLAGIDDGVSGGVVLGLVEVALADFLVEGRALGFHAIKKRGEAFGGGDFIDVEDEVEIGKEIASGDAGGGGDVGHGEAAGGALVGKCGVDVAIGENEVASAEGGEDALLDEFGARGHVQEHLAADGHLEALIGLGQNDVLADALADGGAAGFADLEVFDALLLAEVGEFAELRGLAGAVGAFENEWGLGVDWWLGCNITGIRMPAPPGVNGPRYCGP
jgi:hypothetical protein